MNMSRMKREVFNDYGVPLCEVVSEVPVPKGSQVLVRVGHCGVCHSDIHLHEGYFDLGGGRKLELAGGRPLPFTLGHENEGTIEATRPDATVARAGPRTVVHPCIGRRFFPFCARL